MMPAMAVPIALFLPHLPKKIPLAFSVLQEAPDA
jgi:hypothetical protein